jgi:nicotinate-nucleotide adenylyltransferase
VKIGILGGTFNPIHLAHLRIAEEARDRFALDGVIFIPAATPPHKPLAGDLPFDVRLEMVRRAIAGNPRFSASDMEGRRPGKSYSIDTLRTLRVERPDDEFFFIVGSDSYVDMGLWHEYAGIFSCCNIVVMERPGTGTEQPEAALPPDIAGEFRYFPQEKRLAHRSGHSVYFREGVLLDISSSSIRELVKSGCSIRYLVPDTVATYIKEQRLYSND